MAYTIPPIIHLIWFGENPYPEMVINSWKHHHPQFEVKLWNESNLFPLRNQATFDKSKRMNQKSDIARYEILHKYGGIYVDFDILCIRPIFPLLSGLSSNKKDGKVSQSMAVVWEKKNLISNSFIACTPNHSILENIIHGISKGIDLETSVWKTTGPRVFMEQVLSHPNQEEILLLEYYRFNLCCDFNLWKNKVLEYHPDIQDRFKNRDIRFNQTGRQYNIRDCYGVQLWGGGKSANYKQICKRTAYDITNNLKRYIRYMNMNNNK